MKEKMLNGTDVGAVHTLGSVKERKEKIGKKSQSNINGITLVALVVTVVILLILAGITLTYVLGDNGIIKLAQKAKEETEGGIQNEQDELGVLVNILKEEYGNNIGNENGEGSGGTTNPPTEDKTIADIVDKIQDTNNIVEDKNGNKITIPGGFKVVPNSPDGTDASKKVDYTYNGDGTPAVQDGIVIEDNEGNQFVWIPVGNIKNKDGTTTTITLGRYTFESNGVPTLQQDADNYKEETASQIVDII